MIFCVFLEMAINQLKAGAWYEAVPTMNFGVVFAGSFYLLQSKTIYLQREGL